VLTFTGSNYYTGGTNINAGIVNVSADDNLGAAAATLSLSGGTLKTGATFSTARPMTLSGGGGTFDVSGATQFSVSGLIGGSGSLAKNGPGKLVLSGSNSFSGGVVVNAGTLEVGTDGALGNSGSPVILNAGTLVTTAAFSTSRAITINSGATFRADASVTIDAGALQIHGAFKPSSHNLTVKNGGQVIDDSALTITYGTYNFQSGADFSTAGTLVVESDLIVDGAGSSLTAESWVISGSRGYGSATISHGATASAGDTIVGGDRSLYFGEGELYIRGGTVQLGTTTIQEDSVNQIRVTIYLANPAHSLE
jgi:fibronectin-binding autotransporter adhesin